MTTVEIARRLAALGNREEALKAYELVTAQDSPPAALLEAAAYILQNGGNYKISYTVFVQLYNAGHFQDSILPLMTKAFYEPNIRRLKNRYERNCRRLSKYPYLFRKDFPAFEDLPILFIPYDDHHGYVPFDTRQGKFLNFVNVKNPVVSRNFFRDLEKPILADDVYSQYELEYLYDNVRPSEWVGRENHVYLHYSDWTEFCSWLQVLYLKPVLGNEKIVFLIGDEISRYPIDFQAEFGIDYSQFPVKPVGIREIHRLIWHAQLSAHNGGDFFNEIFDSHPNLYYKTSVMYEDTEKSVRDNYRIINVARDLPESRKSGKWNLEVLNQLGALNNLTFKDVFVAMFMDANSKSPLDPSSRIVPALFFQPHFYNMVFDQQIYENGDVSITSKQLETLQKSILFRDFKYIKTFIPLRRFTTSHGATVRFMYDSAKESRQRRLEGAKEEKIGVVSDAIFERIMNRSFMRGPDDRLYRDSVVVRFEDGKLNPAATFTQLAAFLDLPYTESMTYCSEDGEINPDSGAGKIDPETGLLWQTIGFDTASVYKTYDNYVNNEERLFIEYFLRQAYRYYGYDFLLYDGRDLSEAELDELCQKFTTLDYYIRKTRKYTVSWFVKDENGEKVTLDDKELTERQKAGTESYLNEFMSRLQKQRIENIHFLIQAKRFVDKRGQPLEMIPMIQPDPALIEHPLYH